MDYWDDKYAKQWPHANTGIEDRKRDRRGPYCPPVYPNGWFKVADSREVPVGTVKSVHFWGKDLVVFRGQDGRVGVLDAYCTHLGAHLGIGGRVVGNCLECPFHGWQFDASGKCQRIPYTDASGADAATIPNAAHTHAYTVDETHNTIMLWFDAEGRQPEWRLIDAWPTIPADWTYEGKAVHHIGCHISEVPENGADVAHLNILHEDVHPVVRWLSRFFHIKHRWTASWEPSPDNSAFTVMGLTERVLVTKSEHSLALAANDSDIRQVGPGIVILKLRNAFGEIVLLQSLTPHEPFHQRLETMMFSSPSWLNFHFIMKLILLGYSEQVERDVLIWNKKRYLQRPTLVKGDGPIGKFRRWFSQFYSEHSPTWESIVQERQSNGAKTMDW